MLLLKPDAGLSSYQMNTLQHQFEIWMSRRNADRALSSVAEISVVLATDKGLQRSENQDRVGAIRTVTHAGENSSVAVAALDGMGGKRDGGRCATIALSAFFSGLVFGQGVSGFRRANFALSCANDAVFSFARGNGGATLSAVLIDEFGRAYSVHLGDSRIYAFERGEDVSRLTVDDSIAEAVGGHGRELLQFVGMGPGMRPHIEQLSPSVQNIALTTDGIHYIEPHVFDSVLRNAPSPLSAAERLVALSRWCGSPDNASGAFFNLASLIEGQRGIPDVPVQLWDPFGTAMMFVTEGEIESALSRTRPENINRIISPAPSEPVPVIPAVLEKRSKTKGTRKPRKSRAQKGDIQLEIQIGPTKSDDADGDS